MKKYISKIALVVALTSFSFLTSCSDDDDSTPTPQDTITIDLAEVGLGNSGEATAGGDLHIDAEIEATAKIATVTVEMHHATDPNAPEIEAVFTEYAGMINADFHKHIDIPATQPTGHYHLHLTVVDEKGNTETVEADFEVLEDTNSYLFQVVVTELGTGAVGSSSVNAGSDLHIEATIDSTNPITTVEVELHASGSPEIHQVFSNYAGQTTGVNFHEHVMIPASQPSGQYHFHFVVTDDQGNSSTTEHMITIN